MQLRKISCLCIALVFILSSLLSASIWSVSAEPDPILTLSRVSGYVGDIISVNGTIDTENGFYHILFDGKEIASGTADGRKVETEFAVPNMPAGTYDVTLFDVNASLGSSPVKFTIETAYILDVYEPEKPYQFVEGDNITISVTIKGGENSTTYSLNLTVTFRNETSYMMIMLPTNSSGYAEGNVTYPTDFVGTLGTNFTGIYTVKLNETLAETTFTIGITKLIEYHRGETVTIHAIGYQPSENVTINIKFPNGHLECFNVTATPSGIIEHNWTVPINAPMGIYSLWINNTKEPRDMQNFTIPGFAVNITTVNLGGKPVPSVALEIFENKTSIYNKTTTERGEVSVELEKGNYTWRAIYNEKLVGEGNFTTKGIENENVTLQILLSSLRISVKNERTGKGVPFAKIKLSCNYTTVNNENRSLISNKETDINGTAEFVNIFVNESYTIEAYKYGALFNRTEFFIEFSDKPVHFINVTYPTKTLTVKVSDCRGNSVQGLIVKAYEWTNGTASPTDEEISDENGNVALDLTFGWYRIRVFKSTDTGLILVNETKADLTTQNETIEMEIKCKRLGLNVTVKVVDFLGFPIPNITVKLELVSTSFSINRTGNGEFFFENIIGGKYRILVFLPSNNEVPYLIATYNLNEPDTTVTLKDGDHISLFGILIGTRTFVMIIILIVAAVIIALGIAYRRLSKRWIGKEKV